MRLSTITKSQPPEIALSAEFSIPDEFTGEESYRLLELFQFHSKNLPQDWHLRKNNDGQNVLYWAIHFNQFQLTSEVLNQISNLPQSGRASLQSFLDDHARSDKNLLALAFDTSGLNPNTARQQIIIELLRHRGIVEPLLNHESRLEEQRQQGSLHIAAVHGVLLVFQKLQEWYGRDLAQWLRHYQRDEEDGLTPLDIAIEKGNVEIVKILISSYQRPLPIWDVRANLELLPGTSILHRALSVPSPNQDIVDLIMDKYPNLLWHYDKDCKTPLMELCQRIQLRHQSRRYRADPIPTGEAEEMRKYLETKLFRSDLPISRINRSLGLELEGCEYYTRSISP
jgi:ankyrin repeat protein